MSKKNARNTVGRTPQLQVMTIGWTRLTEERIDDKQAEA